MSRSLLIDAILSQEPTPTDLAWAIRKAFSLFPQDEGDADYIGPAICPKYGKYLPACVSALARACLLGCSIHSANKAFSVPSELDLSQPSLVKLPKEPTLEQIVDALKNQVLPHLFNYLLNGMKWCRDNHVQMNLARSLSAGFGAKKLLAPEWDLIVYLNFLFPIVPRGRGTGHDARTQCLTASSSPRGVLLS